MELFEDVTANHALLRGACGRLEVLLARPSGCGWDDRMTLDSERLSREFSAFEAALKAHDAIEAAYMALVLGELETDRAMIAKISTGHKAVEDLARLMGAVAFLCDGEHVHRLRTVLERLAEEVEAHLAYAENVVFPRLRARLTESQLRAFWLRSFVVPAAGIAE